MLSHSYFNQFDFSSEPYLTFSFVSARKHTLEPGKVILGTISYLCKDNDKAEYHKDAGGDVDPAVSVLLLLLLFLLLLLLTLIRVIVKTLTDRQHCLPGLKRRYRVWHYYQPQHTTHHPQDWAPHKPQPQYLIPWLGLVGIFTIFMTIFSLGVSHS